ncbi:transposable element Tcb1 transposase [Trichonephila clavipes]|nr:transposable element Tcb1 transposase [Trichonephila clavipes]
MTGHIYRDVILEQHVRLFRGAMGAEFLFMDDNARPHRTNIVDECLQSEDHPYGLASILTGFESNRALARQVAKSGGPSVPISVFVTLDAEVSEQMFRSGGQSDANSEVTGESLGMC